MSELSREILEHLLKVKAAHATTAISLTSGIGLVGVIVAATSKYNPWLTIALLLTTIVVIGSLCWASVRGVPYWRARIAGSTLIEQLGAGTLPSLLEAVPWPAKFVMRNWLVNDVNLSGELKAACSAVAGNLDWYLRPTPKLFRLSWIAVTFAYVGMFAMPLTGFMLLLLDGTSALRLLPAMTSILLPSVLIAAIPTVGVATKRWTWTSAFLLEMEARLKNS